LLTSFGLSGQPTNSASTQSINDVRQQSIISSRAPIFDTLVQKSDAQFGSIYTFSDSSSYVTFQQFSQVIDDFINNEPLLGFRLKTIQKSVLDPTLINYRYKQLYDGMPIVNAGYAITLEDGEVLNGQNAEALQRPEPSDCAYLRALSPNFTETYSVSPSALMDTATLKEKIKDNYPHVVSFGTALKWIAEKNDPGELNYQAIVKSNDGKTYAYIVDPYDASVLATYELSNNIDAETEYYGFQNMEELSFNNGFLLVSDNGVATYDYTRASGTQWVYDAANIPFRLNNFGWPVDVDALNLSRYLYQTHYATERVVAPFLGMGIEFENIFVKAEGENNARSRRVSDYDDTENAYIRIGRIGSSSSATGFDETFATFDIIGHELGHTFFGRNISGNSGDARAIDEGVADILGTYAESVVQGSVDFLMGDDTPNGDAIFVGRSTDLANHPYSCYDNLPNCDVNDGNLSCRYDRSGPMLRWFANVVQGVPAEMIEPINIFDVTAVVVEAVTLMDENDAQLEDFRDATLAATLNQFGQCSVEFTSIARSWNSVCLGVIPVCPVTLAGPVSHCVDNGNPAVVFSLGIQDPLPNVTYRWNFPPEWTVSGVANGIGTKDGLGILVLDAPSYPSYPRTFLVQVYPVQLGSAFKARVNFRFKECLGGGSSNCGLAFSFGESNNDALTFGSRHFSTFDEEITATNAVVFDLLGRRVIGLSGNSEAEMLKQILRDPNTPNIFFVSFTDPNGQLIKTVKYVNTSRL
jgi:hypothetical protein